MNQAFALTILKSGANVFLTGEPGSGKTYLINEYVSYLNSHGIKPAITASTGIAATHIGGMTIHSWCGIGIKNRLEPGDLHRIATNDYVKKRVGTAKILIIDEISMLPPQTLQMIDAICREVKDTPLPFGGMQVVLVGDFFQLPPVNKNIVNDFENEFSQENLFEETPMRFAYDAEAFLQAEFVTCYLTEQHRQDDDELVSILSKIRGNVFDEVSLLHIQNRKIDLLKAPENAPKLYSHNFDVDKVNDQTLAKIPGDVKFFPMKTKGHEKLVAVMKKGCLSPESLYLKVGASVMFTKNNQKEGFVNGTLGIVEDFNEENGLPIVVTRHGDKIEVDYAEWAVEEDGKVKGRLAQLPLRLAWAITVHKSQGISLDEAIIDLSRVFEFGQGYVAISRVKRLTGIYLLGWNEKAFQVDPEVLQKDKELQIESASAEKLYSRLSEKELKEMYDEFIKNCGGEIDTSKVVITKKVKIDTYAETLKLFKENMDLKTIAKKRKLSQNTIVSHIEKLVEEKKIDSSELTEILPPKLLKDLPTIYKAFKKLKTDKLTPVYKHFLGKYSYDELKLARMTINNI